MASIPISLLPNVQPSGYTPQDLLVIVNYDFPVLSPTGTTKNTPLSGISSYIASAITSSPITFNSPVTFNGGLSSTTIVSSAITVNGPSVFSSITANNITTSAITVNGPSVFNSITANNITTSAITVNGPSVFSSITANNITTSAITVNGPSIFSSGATVNGDLIVSGTVSANTGIFNYLSANTANIDSLTATTISASIYLNLPGSSSGNCFDDFYTDNLHACNTVITFHNSYQSVSSTSNGIESRSFGDSNIAVGNYSHAEGYKTESVGEYSHSEGILTNSIGFGSHSEGGAIVYPELGPPAKIIGGTSIGIGSHAEGRETISSGMSSHSEGMSTTSVGDYSHSEGFETIAGYVGYRISAYNSALGLITLSSIYGDVTSYFPGGNILINGNVIAYTGSTFSTAPNTTLFVSYQTDLLGVSSGDVVVDILDLYNSSGVADKYVGPSHSEGEKTLSIGYGSHSEGYQTTTYGLFSNTKGYKTKSYGNYSVSEGYETVSFGNFSNSSGYNTKSIGIGSNSEGQRTISGGKFFVYQQIISGVTVSINSDVDLSSEFTSSKVVIQDNNLNFIIRDYSGTSWNPITEKFTINLINSGDYGYITSVSGFVADIEKLDSSLLSGQQGSKSIVGVFSHSEGGSGMFGEKNLALNNYSHTEGYETKALGDSSHSEGTGCVSIGGASHSEGITNKTFGAGSHSEGKQNISYGNFSHSEGLETKAGWKGLKIKTVANGLITLSEKYLNVSSQFTSGSVFLDGKFYPISGCVYNTGINSTQIQLSNTDISSGSYVAPGDDLYNFYGNYYLGDSSHSEGYDTRAVGDNSHSEGVNNDSYGQGSHSEGTKTASYGNFSHSEGDDTYSYGKASHSEGGGNRSYGEYSHSEGCTTVSGWRGFSLDSFVSGGLVILNSDYGNISSEFSSTGTLLLNDGSDNFVYDYSGVTYNSGNTTVEIQLINTAITGNYIAVASTQDLENKFADIFLGSCSHSEGQTTHSIGDGSHSEGRGTVTYGHYQHATGMYNITGDTQQGAFIIGNGTDDSNRSNLLRAAGNEVNVSGKTITTNFQMTSGATSTGYVMVDSDGNGNAQWQPISFITGGTLMSTSEINVSAYTATTSFDYYGTTYTGGSITIQLPNPSTTPNGFRLTIKDETTNSAVYNITITTPSGNIDNSAFPVVMSTNQMSLTLVVRNNNWWII